MPITRLAAPQSVADLISDRAVRNAREDVRSRGWKSSGALQPYAQPGEVGISTTVKYLMFQNVGVSPYIMWWVKDRVVPLGCKQGDGPHLRSGRTVGTPGYVNIPHVGKRWRDQRWKYPGLKPKRFLESAIQRAIKDSHDDVRKELAAVIRGPR